MKITLDVPAEIAQALAEVAKANGQIPTDYAAQILVSHLAPVAALLRRQGQAVSASYLLGTKIPSKTAGILPDFILPSGQRSHFTFLDLSCDHCESLNKETYIPGIVASFWHHKNASTNTPHLFITSSRASEEQPEEDTKAKRSEAISQGFGFLKGRVSGSDVFLEEKHAEAQREREKDEAHGYGQRKTGT